MIGYKQPAAHGEPPAGGTRYPHNRGSSRCPLTTGAAYAARSQPGQLTLPAHNRGSLRCPLAVELTRRHCNRNARGQIPGFPCGLIALVRLAAASGVWHHLVRVTVTDRKRLPIA